LEKYHNNPLSFSSDFLLERTSQSNEFLCSFCKCIYKEYATQYSCEGCSNLILCELCYLNLINGNYDEFCKSSFSHDSDHIFNVINTGKNEEDMNEIPDLNNKNKITDETFSDSVKSCTWKNKPHYKYPFVITNFPPCIYIVSNSHISVNEEISINYMPLGFFFFCLKYIF
jgi:hypothetical protein